VVRVDYQHEFPYISVGEERFPILQLIMEPLAGEEASIEVDAILDTGARYSLFDGRLLAAINLDLNDGAERTYYPVRGAGISARVHSVRISHEYLGDFNLNIGFSTEGIPRNLLGRDFFDRVQIGFREHHLIFYANSAP
jgi:hypothetical protein